MSENINLTVLGSTGSIGVNTLDVIASQLDRYSVFAITANSNISTLFDQCIRFQPRYAVVVKATKAKKDKGRTFSKSELLKQKGSPPYS